MPTHFSEYAGQVLRVDGGEGVFLDVVLLSKVLNPILDHTLRGRVLGNSQLNMAKDELLNKGVLRCNLARHLWRDVLSDHAKRSSSVGLLEVALFEVLIKRGVVLPLSSSQAVLPVTGGGGRVSTTPSLEGEGLRDMLVRRWLPPRLDERLQKYLDRLLENTVQRGAKEVILGYEFDPAGPPQGLVGRLIASCHVIGEAEMKLCWRSGAVFKGPPAVAVAAAARDRVDRLYVVEVRYNSTNRILSIRMFGTLESEWVWAALRFIASVMVNISSEWPGVLWAGWLQCPAHVHYRVHLATPTEVRTPPLNPLGAHEKRQKLRQGRSYRNVWEERVAVTRFIHHSSRARARAVYF